MMTKEAMKLALEALEGIHPGNMTPMAEEYWNKAITALREALAEQPAQIAGFDVVLDASMPPNTMKFVQPAQQEPVAWMCHPFGDEEVEYGPHQQCENCIPLYTSPPAQRTWVGLTDEEVINVMPDDDTPMSLGEAFSVFAELIEAKLKEKNT